MTRSIFIAGALALAAVLPAIPAQATLLTRTFVSSAGSNSNPCTITQPCASFATAYSLTAPSGIIAALDPGKYGPLTITGPITIDGNGWAAITAPAGGNGITINAVSGNVALTGLKIDGAGAANNGIQFNSGDSLSVSDSVIRNIGAASGTAGIVYKPGASSTLSVSNTSVSDSFEGIDILPSGTGTTAAVLDHVKMERNANYGLQVQTSSQSINVTVSESVVSSNPNGGIVVSSPQVKSINVIVRNSIIANNQSGYGLWAVFDNAVIRVTRSTITGNNTAFFGDSGGSVKSFGDNNIAANANPVSAPPTIGEQ